MSEPIAELGAARGVLDEIDAEADLLTCVQHVLLSSDTQKSSVANLDVRGPYCGGL
ncbi:hypothetical protein [Methylocystis bryophila]|uniref:hypothetical protein n=1 Tax=Methylocystis bryophila TaxID=655015 RepID=UPI00131A31AC|nr:hypothetical protein [Methylocystis bryophila]